MTLTPAAADGPALLTVSVNVMLEPTFGVGLLETLVIDRFACATGPGGAVAVLLPGVGSLVVLVTDALLAYGPAALTVATLRAREAIARVLTHIDASQAIPLTVSIGVTEINVDDNCADDTLARADRALYRAKESGRNRVTVEA